MALRRAARGQCGVGSWLRLSRLICGSRKDLTCDTGSRISADSAGCQEALCIKLRGEIFQPVYSFPPKAYTYKHPQHIHAAQTSARMTRASDAHAVRKRAFCHLWLHSVLAWWMTQQENQPDSARQRLCLSFAPYIHKSLIIAPVLTIYIFIHLSALVSKGRGWLLRYLSSFVCLVEVFTDVTSMWVKNNNKKNCVSRFHMLKRTAVAQYPTWPILFPVWKQLVRPPFKVLKVPSPAADRSHLTSPSLSAAFVPFRFVITLRPHFYLQL